MLLPAIHRIVRRSASGALQRKLPARRSLAAAAALMIASAQAQDPVEVLVKTIAHSQGILYATEIACGVTHPGNFRRRFTEIVARRDGKFMADALRQVSAQQDYQLKHLGLQTCTQEAAIFMRLSASMLQNDIDELDRRLAR